MKFTTDLAIKNIIGHTGRSIALIVLAALLSGSVFGGSLVIDSLKNGLNSYEDRLGADIMVASKDALNGGKFESILLQGIPGYFYMSDSVIETVKNVEGVELVTPQFYLTSASAGCCDAKVQIIGFDPDSDFTVQPWIKESYDQAIKDGDVIVGCNIDIPSDNRFKIYGISYNVVARLDKTGTGLDSAIYANTSTIRMMMESSKQAGFDYFDDIEPEHAVSSLMVRVKNGYDIEDVQEAINLQLEDAKAVSSKDMISGISEGLGTISKIIGLLVIVIWVFSFAVLVVAFAMIVNERVRELAVLRISGASKKMISKVLIGESVFMSLIGGLSGNALAALIIFPFADSFKVSLNLPILLPDSASIACLFVGSFIASLLVCGITSAICAYRITSKDTGLIFRNGA